MPNNVIKSVSSTVVLTQSARAEGHEKGTIVVGDISDDPYIVAEFPSGTKCFVNLSSGVAFTHIANRRAVPGHKYEIEVK